MPYCIRSYEGQDEWVSKKWLAHMNLGNDIYMTFFGATKVEAEAKARDWYEKEKKYAEKIDTSRKEAPVKLMNNDSWGDNQWTEEDKVILNNRGHHFTGKVWMVKGEGWDKQKKRVDKSEVEALEADGWRKGGPRS